MMTDISSAGEERTIISPRRLVFIEMWNSCMFCRELNYAAYLMHVSVEAKVGYICCPDCKEKAEEMMKIWNKKYAYGEANYLKDKAIKILRSSGEIEDGWRLNNPLIDVSPEGKIIISCCHHEKKLEKWCYLRTILELNPK
jgi:hypothetical protein